MKKYDMVRFYGNQLTSRLGSKSLDVLNTVQDSKKTILRAVCTGERVGGR